MDFKIGALKNYTNNITQSVGPTTSQTSRSLVDSTTTHLIYTDGTYGDDLNGGTGPSDAVKTIARAYAIHQLGGLRALIHIIDDTSDYDVTSVLTFDQGNDWEGIQAALGVTPRLNFHSGGRIVFDTNPGCALSGCFFNYVTSGVEFVGFATNAKVSDIKIIDNYFQGNESLIYFDSSTFSGDIDVKYNIFELTSKNYFIAQIVGSTSSSEFNNNILYMNYEPPDGTASTDYAIAVNLGGTLQLDFDSASLVATINGASPVSSFSPGAHIGQAVFFTGVGTYKITNNNTTQLFLEDAFGVASGDLTNVVSTIRGLYFNAAVNVRADTAADVDLNVEKNIIVGNNQKFGIIQRTDPTWDTVTVMQANVIFGVTTGVAMIVTGSGTGTMSTLQSIFYTTNQSDTVDYLGESATPGGSELLYETNYDNDILPLYFNEQNALIPSMVLDATLGYVKCAYDFRLRAIGKKYYTTDTNYMRVDSPLLDYYTVPTPDEDLCPWEETLVAGSITYASTVTLNKEPRQLNGSYNPRNPVELLDFLGNPAVDQETLKKEFAFDWASDYTENYIVWKLAQIKEDKKVKQWYPLGDGNSLMTDLAGSNLSGALVGATNTFTPASLPYSMIPHHWKGWWITFNSKDFYIADNTASAFTLIDKLGLGYPADSTYEFTIEYMLVHVRPSPLPFKQANFTNFIRGGQWQEQDNIKQHVYTGPSIILIETENPL